MGPVAGLPGHCVLGCAKAKGVYIACQMREDHNEEETQALGWRVGETDWWQGKVRNHPPHPKRRGRGATAQVFQISGNLPLLSFVRSLF